MVYFKAREEFGKHSLVPFTAPIVMGNIIYDGTKCFGRLTCNDRCIFIHKFKDEAHNELQARNKMHTILGTAITYINEAIMNAIDEGEPNTIIDVDVWSDDFR